MRGFHNFLLFYLFLWKILLKEAVITHAVMQELVVPAYRGVAFFALKIFFRDNHNFNYK